MKDSLKKVYVLNKGLKNIPVDTIAGMTKRDDGYTQIWHKPTIAVTPLRELQDELAEIKAKQAVREKRW